MPPNNSARMWNARQEGKAGREILSVMERSGHATNVKRVERRLVQEQEQL